MIGLRGEILSDQGAFYADAQPTKFRAGLFHIVTGSYDIPAAHVVADGGTRTRPRRRRVPLLVPRHRGLVPDRAARRERRARARSRSGAVPPRQLHPAGAVPVRVGDRLRLRLGRLRTGDARSRSSGSATRSCGASRRRRGRRGGCSGSGSRVHRGRRRRAGQDVRHRRAPDVRLGRAPRPPDRQGDPQARRQVAGPGPRDDVRADRRRGARDPDRGRRGAGGRHRQHTVRARHVRESLDAGRGRRDGGRSRASCATRRGRSPRTCSRRRPDDIEFEAGRFFVKGSPERAKTIQDVAFAAYTNLPDGMEAGLEGVTTTTRRT